MRSGRRRLVERAGLLVVVAVLAAAGCSFRAYDIDPRPWIEGKRLPVGMRTQVTDAVPDRFIEAADEGIPDLDVKGWRDAVALGLERARPQRFGSAEEHEGHAWQIVVEQADLDLIPLAWGAEGTELFGAQVDYQALLFDDNNTLVETLTGTAASKKPFRGVTDGSPLLAQAIASMSEELIQRAATHVERRLAGSAAAPSAGAAAEPAEPAAAPDAPDA